MKKNLFLYLFFFTVQSFYSQTVFCPPGAEWHYNYKAYDNTFSGNVYIRNHSVKYMRDSVIGQSSYKVLQHSRFFADCDLGSSSRVTLLKQTGDTVFFRNYNTDHTWQVFFNFNTTAGQSWMTSVREKTNTVSMHTITVLAVGMVTVNSYPLKQYTVTDVFRKPLPPPNDLLSTNTFVFTERLGNSAYFFSFNNFMHGACDIDYFYNNLCYTDDKFGSYQYSEKDCDYAFVGLNEFGDYKNVLSVYPNPTSEVLNFKMDDWREDARVTVVNCLGQEIPLTVLNRISSGHENQLNLSHLKQGLYTLKVFDKQELIAIKKFVKE